MFIRDGVAKSLSPGEKNRLPILDGHVNSYPSSRITQTYTCLTGQLGTDKSFIHTRFCVDIYDSAGKKRVF